MEPQAAMFLLIVFTLLGAAIYFFPSIIAFGRQHHQQWAILVLNLFLGWTLIGWVAALVWAATRVRRDADFAR